MPKNPETSSIYQIYRAIASTEECEALAARYRAGIGWGEAKGALFERLDRELAPARAKYDALMADPQQIDALLAAGAVKARKTARGVLDRVRRAIGISR